MTFPGFYITGFACKIGLRSKMCLWVSCIFGIAFFSLGVPLLPGPQHPFPSCCFAFHQVLGLCNMSCQSISAKMLADVRVFSSGDICILIDGLNMEELQPEAGRPHWGRGGQFWMGVRVCKIWDIIKSYSVYSMELAFLFSFVPKPQSIQHLTPSHRAERKAFYRLVGSKTATFLRVLELNKSPGSSIIGESPLHLLLYEGDDLSYFCKALSKILLWNLVRRCNWAEVKDSERCFFLFLTLGADRGWAGSTVGFPTSHPWTVGFSKWK